VTHRLEATRVTADAGSEMVVPHSLGLTRKTTTAQATAQSLRISVLDLVPTRPGEPAGRAIARSVELARHVEQLGYRRYWVAEHHTIQGLACSATPVLIGHIAAGTKTIRVGSGGVMLPNHAPLVVAEQDVAEAAAVILMEGSEIHGGKDYWFSADVLAPPRVAETLSAATGQKFTAEVLDAKSFLSVVAQPGSAFESAYAKGGLELFSQVEDGRMAYVGSVRDDTRKILGREPLLLRDWAQLHADELLEIAGG